MNSWRNGDVVVCGDGAASVVPARSGASSRQRLFANSGSASMGYDLPAAVAPPSPMGAAASSAWPAMAASNSTSRNSRPSFITNLPVKIFVLNNGGYLSIRTTQSTFFQETSSGEPPQRRFFPDLVRIAEAYGIPGAPHYPKPVCRRDRLGPDSFRPLPLRSKLAPLKSSNSPYLAHSPRRAHGFIATRRPLPLLDPEELRANMLEPE